MGVCDGFLISHAARWTPEENMRGLPGQPDEISSWANAISWGGSTIVGQTKIEGGSEAFLWTEASGFVMLGDLPGGNPQSRATSASGDGAVVVGTGNADDGQARAFRWTEDEGMVSLGMLPNGANSSCGAISADGRVIAGQSAVPGAGLQAFRWTENEGMVGLGDLPGGSVFSVARGVASHGNVIVGYGLSEEGWEAFRWTEDEGMVGLGSIEESQYSFAWDVSADGTVVVGESKAGGRGRAFIWTPAEGMRNLQEVIQDDLGLDLGTMQELIKASAVSADGRTIVGWGFNDDGGVEAWLVYLGSVCRADFDKNGTVEATDVLAYLQAWQDERFSTDWNYDAIIDTRDIIAFLREWVASCP